MYDYLDLRQTERLKELVPYKVLAPDADEIIKELERLNNIINELEKWLDTQHQFIIEIPAYTKEIQVEHKTMEICYENILDKLKELKGEDTK